MATVHYKKNKSSASPPEGSPGSSSPSSPVNASHGNQQPAAANNAPKYGTLVPNRIFVGGISGNTTENELAQLFSAYGNVKATKVISDRAGVSKGYGFVTFETAEEAARLMTQESESIVLKERKLNIAPAIKKQPFNRSYEVTSPPAVHGNTIFYQNGMPYTFHNGVAYFASAPAPHAASSTPLTSGGDPTALYSAAAAYMPQAAATAHSPPAAFPVLYPCTAQPVYMSQQFQYPPLPAQGSHQLVYAGAGPSPSPGGGPGSGGQPTSQNTVNQPQSGAGPAPLHVVPPHYYAPAPPPHAAPAPPGPSGPDLYYSLTPVHHTAHPYATATLFTAAPDGFLFETPPVTESSANQSPEDSSSSSSRSEPTHIRSSLRDTDGTSTHLRDGSCPPPPSASAPPVVSLLKLHHQQQQQHTPQPIEDGAHFRQMPPPPPHMVYGSPVFLNHQPSHSHRPQPPPSQSYRQPRGRRPQFRREAVSPSAAPLRQNGAGPPAPRYGFPAGRRGGGFGSTHRRPLSPSSAHTPPPVPYSPASRSRVPFPQPAPPPSHQFQATARGAPAYFQPVVTLPNCEGPRRYGSRKSGPGNGGRGGGGVAQKIGASRVPCKMQCTDEGGAGDSPSVMPLPPPPTSARSPSPCESDGAMVAVAQTQVSDATRDVCRELQALSV